MGSYTKEQTRKLLKEAGLHGKVKPESQDICFLPQGDYGRFIASRFPDQNNEGSIVNRRGEVLGKHQGLFRYTIGQRRGLGIAAKKPYYVLRLSPANNTLVVDLAEQCVHVGELHHALKAKLLTEADVHAELGDIIAGRTPGRTSESEITIFDSTGTALQDTAAAIVAYERARETGAGQMFGFGAPT